MPYIQTRIHDITYNQPPGTMNFTTDWELDFDYDEINNPNPIREIDFMTDLEFTDRAAPQSLKYDIPIYYEIGYLWLHRGRRQMEGLSPLRLRQQLHFNGARQRVCEQSGKSNNSRDKYTHITLEFNPALIASVHLICYPPPIWVDD